MRFLIFAALAVNLGSSVYASDGRTEKVEVRSYSADGRRWVTAFHEGQNVDHDGGSIVSHVSTIRNVDYFEVLRNDDHDLTRLTVELGGTPGFGPVQSMQEAAPSNLVVPSLTPWTEVERFPEPSASSVKPKAGWNGENVTQGWREKAIRPRYEESSVIAIGKRAIVRPNRPAREETVRVQRYYRQRVGNSHLSILLLEPNPDDGAFKRLYVERNGLDGTIDLNGSNTIGEIIGFNASGDHQRIFVVTTGLVRYPVDIVGTSHGLEFHVRGGSGEEVVSGILTKPVSRPAKVRVVEREVPAPTDACHEPLTEAAMAAE